MPIQPLAFHYCGVYFQSLCKKPKLKKKQMKKMNVAEKKDSVRGSQESLFSAADGSESNATEVSTEPSIMSSETSGVCSDPELNGDKNEISETDKKIEKSDVKDGSEKDVGNDLEGVDNDVVEAAKKRDLSTNEIVAQMKKKQDESHKTNLSKAKVLVIILLLTNIPVALYFCLIHQRGTIMVMKYIHDESLQKNVDVLYLMPCHSTPYYRYIVHLSIFSLVNTNLF